MAVSIHHIIIAVLTLIVIFLLHKYKDLDFRIKPETDGYSARITAVCCAAYLIYYIIWYIVFGFILNEVSGCGYELNAVNILGTLGFQLLLSGTAEELVFRALPVTLLLAVCDENSRTDKIMIIAVTSMLFTIAHINSTVPLISQWYGLMYAFVGGVILGIAYMRSKSVIYPAIIHGFSNLFSVGGCYLYMVIKEK